VVPGYSYEFYEADCAAAPGSMTVYQTYTNGAAQAPVITPQILVVTSISSYITTAPAAQPTGGTIINCGNGGSNGNTCNVGSGNNGDGVKSGSAPSFTFSVRTNGLLILILAFWMLVELFGLSFS
jgi:hypothetical protein